MTQTVFLQISEAARDALQAWPALASVPVDLFRTRVLPVDVQRGISVRTVVSRPNSVTYSHHAWSTDLVIECGARGLTDEEALINVDQLLYEAYAAMQGFADTPQARALGITGTRDNYQLEWASDSDETAVAFVGFRIPLEHDTPQHVLDART